MTICLEYDEYDLFKSIRIAQDAAAKNYIKISTSFMIGFPPNNNKLHLLLFDSKTKEIIKKINFTRLITSSLTDEILGILENISLKNNEKL